MRYSTFRINYDLRGRGIDLDGMGKQQGTLMAWSLGFGAINIGTDCSGRSIIDKIEICLFYMK